MSGNNSKTCFAYARYQKSLVLLDENCVKVATSGTGYPPEFNNCVAGESFEKSLLPNSYNTRPQ